MLSICWFWFNLVLLSNFSKRDECHQDDDSAINQRDDVTYISYHIITSLNFSNPRHFFYLIDTLLICQKQFKIFHQGHPMSIFGKYLFGRRFEIYNFRNICCKISCLPASPRIFEHLKSGIIAHFSRIFTLKRSPRISGSLFSGWNFRKGKFWLL